MAGYLLQNYLDGFWRDYPEKPALVDREGPLSYEILQQESNRLARCLVEQGVKRQERVLICMKRTAKVILAIMGILKADAVYVPVDASSPMERIAKIAQDCQPSAIICEESLLGTVEELLPQVPSVHLLVVFGDKGGASGHASVRKVYWEELKPLRPEDTEPRQYRNIDTDTAYILYTSGSTGTPKGVTISHLNIINYIEWAVTYFDITQQDRVLGTAPFHFDMSTFDIFASIKAGATLYIAPERNILFPKQLMDMIEREQITIWKGVASLLMYLSKTEALKPERIPTLKKVLFGGEVLPTKHLMNWMNTFPEKEFYNVYGPTEATGISACHRVAKPPQAAHETVPIGRACSNSEILVLTEEGSVAEIGETGELCIRGSCLSLGYWNDEEKTARSFVRNPLGRTANDRIYRTGDLARITEDGFLEYLGRKDFQIKFMGYRIETFEVEKAFLTLKDINHAAVLLCSSADNDIPELVAFVESRKERDTDSIISDLSRSLPHYMIPNKIMPLAKIPLNDRGKTDRAALRKYYQGLAMLSAGGDSPPS